jgi:hypothetical protein
MEWPVASKPFDRCNLNGMFLFYTQCFEFWYANESLLKRWNKEIIGFPFLMRLCPCKCWSNPKRILIKRKQQESNQIIVSPPLASSAHCVRLYGVVRISMRMKKPKTTERFAMKLSIFVIVTLTRRMPCTVYISESCEDERGFVFFMCCGWRLSRSNLQSLDCYVHRFLIPFSFCLNLITQILILSCCPLENHRHWIIGSEQGFVARAKHRRNPFRHVMIFS